MISCLHLIESPEIKEKGRLLFEFATVVQNLGGRSFVTAERGRIEPVLRRNGAVVLEETIGETAQRGLQSRLNKLIGDEQINLVIAYGNEGNKLAETLRKGQNFRLLTLPQTAPKPARFKLFSKHEQPFKNADAIVADNQGFADLLISQSGVGRNEISIVHDCIDPELASEGGVSGQRTASLAMRWGVVDHVADIILVPAAFDDQDWRKNFLETLKLSKSSPFENALYVVIGDDGGSGYMNRLENQIADLELTYLVKFVGHCADFASALKLSTLLVDFGSTYPKSYPLAIAAQAMGRPVILPNSSSAHEFISEGQTGNIATDPSDYFGFIQTILQLNESSRQSLATHARFFATHHFSPLQTRDAIESILLNLGFTK